MRYSRQHSLTYLLTYLLTHSLTYSLFSHAFTSVIRTFRCNSSMTLPIPSIPTAAKSMVTYVGKTILHSLGITQYCKCTLIIYTFSHYFSLLLLTHSLTHSLNRYVSLMFQGPGKDKYMLDEDLAKAELSVRY